ncbi:DNA polymerase III subunit delta [Solilutibacter silvestris]|uniref:DNA polymerase III subunit delta n=1 Tax=Solilutibacter silvestris TaxID=1645665 RepID=A0A2K1Q3A3_9GAMM|nr:DNA polymerase III subunit delta [Lysobacter silvestris]PNS09519.1 holA: DNA polymerase III, delta subunit [Lysobacter silvestris]
MELTPERLVAQLGREPLRPAYLIAGAEPLRVLEAADAVRAQARADGCTEREVFEADDRGFDWDGVAASFQAMGLFSRLRLIDLRLPTGKPGKDGSEVITTFCAAPPADTILLVTAGEWSKSHAGKWSEAIARIGTLAIAWPVKPHEWLDWVERRLNARGLKAERDAIDHLAQRTEGNLLAAAQEIDKLALLVEPGEVLNAARMDALVADAARFDVFRLIDAALAGQPSQVARMLATLRAEGLAVPALLGMVVMELQRLASLSRVQARGGNVVAEFKAQRVWDSKQAVYRRALGRHATAHWDALLAEVGHVDRASKGRAPGDPWILLERVLLAVAEPRAFKLIAARA